MITYRCHFQYHLVWLVVEMRLETKHLPIGVLEEACDKYARQINATFLYHEEVK
jgi:hypothetical protein